VISARVGPLPAYLLALFAALLIACGGSSPAPPAATTPGASPAATERGQVSPSRNVQQSIEPNGNRIMADVRLLADDIGPRPAGTESEKQAADLIAERLRGLGYSVSLQEFSIGRQTGRSSSLDVLQPSSRQITTLPFGNSATDDVEGRLVAAGIGRPQEFPSEVRGAIALIQRGELTFAEKVANAASAGAIGAVIYNNEPGSAILGGLNEESRIPAVSISREDGEALLQQASAGGVRVEMSVGALSGETSYNVIATPPGRDCETVSGGHYDSVPQAPGASDNATGTAAVLEIAAVLASRDDMDNHCFVLFGAEELGLIGSRHYVSTLDAAARNRIKAMLNFDMVGVGDESWLLIGTPELQERMASLARQIGIETEAGRLGANMGSDHASFTAAGIPALMFHRNNDPLLHTPQDVSDRVNPRYLEEAARMGLALLQSLSGGS
jgi:aminopeptidase YwaD